MPITKITGSFPLAMSELLANKPAKMYMYMEYTNSASDVPVMDAAAINANFANPTTYYSTLANTRNYIRVSAAKNPVPVMISDNNFQEITNTYFAQSALGAQVLTGSDRPNFGNGSICYGAALVLALQENDHTKDIVIARSYFTGANEPLTRTATSEVFISFPLSIRSTKV